jgi:peptidoglycan/xylan/chitin deacetylase (PgdA/CDA1 family)
MKFTNMNKIINFHQVNDIEWFDNLILFLKSKHNMVSVDSIYEFYLGHITLKNSCHITVDDGDKTFYDIIFPVLKKHNVAASLYVSPKICEEESNFWFQEIAGYNLVKLKRVISDVTGFPLDSLLNYNAESILKTLQIHQIYEIIKVYQKSNHISKKVFQNITINKLKEIDKSGIITIGGHTMNHPILSNETDANSKYEIHQSINELSNILNHQIKYFAYPNGIYTLDFTEREKMYLKDVSVNLAFTTESKNLSLSDNLASIPRIQVSNKENKSLIEIKLFLGSNWNSLKKLKRSGEYRERKKLISNLQIKKQGVKLKKTSYVN